MATRRGATSLEGILVVDKPSGMTSHDVISAVRRMTGEGRVGHAGTLDPSATGVLVVLVGPYTRLEPYLSAATKSYEATIAFGAATDTDDAEGAVIAMAPVPAGVDDQDKAREAVARLVGSSLQRPPDFSAIKRGGQTAHRAARAGQPLEVEPRPIRVDAAELLDHDPVLHTWRVALTVSKGTYIRAIARDLGQSLGTHAHLTSLRRSASGTLDLGHAVTLEELGAASDRGGLASYFVDPFVALDMPVVHCRAEEIADGRPLPDRFGLGDGDRAAISVAGRLAAIYRATPGRLVPDAVFPAGRP